MSIEPHLVVLRQRLEPRLDALREICRRWDAELACNVQIFEASAPTLHFDQSMLRLLCEIGAEIDLDIYCL